MRRRTYWQPGERLSQLQELLDAIRGARLCGLMHDLGQGPDDRLQCSTT
jgi:hypothetical protein